jgi:cysteate synthase
MLLHLVQGEPFAPMRDAWRARCRELPAIEPGEARRRIAGLYARVLANRAPPWGIIGGMFDTLRECGGTLEAVDGTEARQAGALFEECEGCDLDPAAEVALAGLAAAVRRGAIPRGDRILLNLTGGGARRMAADGMVRFVKPDVVVERPGDGLAALDDLLGRPVPRSIALEVR